MTETLEQPPGEVGPVEEVDELLLLLTPGDRDPGAVVVVAVAVSVKECCDC